LKEEIERRKAMLCPICGTESKPVFQGKIMRKYIIQYYQCHRCGFLHTEKPYWIQEAYQDAITSVDTGIMLRTMDNVFVTNMLVHYYFDRDTKFLDYGGGYGIFTRMMRDLGYDWVWYDKYSENLTARGFEYDEKDEISLISAFELFEHFENPIEELKHLFSISKSILFSTLIYDEDLQYKNFEDWWYYVPETGQHISFYSQRTLEYIAKEYNVHYYKINEGMHLFTEQKIDHLKFRMLFHSRISGRLQYYHYKKNRRNGLAMQDMQTILKKRQIGE
jgi:predicted RNA-binding Zn-ribbon protein involved in translation (DUF1610 family)